MTRIPFARGSCVNPSLYPNIVLQEYTDSSQLEKLGPVSLRVRD